MRLNVDRLAMLIRSHPVERLRADRLQPACASECDCEDECEDRAEETDAPVREPDAHDYLLWDLSSR